MIHTFKTELTESWHAFTSYLRQEKGLCRFTALAILFLYGIRLTQGDLFVDSDIMLTEPEGLMFSWYGHQRFGLIVTKKLFSLVRLLPFQANALFLLTMYILVLGICFCFFQWSGGDKSCRKGAFLFAGLFLSAPCFAEQFNFVLQAFESAAAMFFCVIAAYCSGRWIYEKKNILWALPAVAFMTWAFGSYQAYPAFYIAVVLISYITVYICQKEICGFREGLRHAGLFLAGFFSSRFCSAFLCKLQGASSGYVDAMFWWGVKDLDTCLGSIREDVFRIYRGTWPLFFSKWFLPASLTATALALFLGWRRRSRKFPCFLLALALLWISPILITLITAMPQPIRGQMTYPLVYGWYMMFLYTALASLSVRQPAWLFLKKTACITAAAACAVLGWRQGIAMCQLWETAHEQYVSDTLTANRMYLDICRAADRSDMENCKVVFVGTRETQLGGTPLTGDVIGHSFFEWDASGPVGVSSRVNVFFKTLGLYMALPGQEDYEKAVNRCKDRPLWPASDSVFLLDPDTVVVKLSEAE